MAVGYPGSKLSKMYVAVLLPCASAVTVTVSLREHVSAGWFGWSSMHVQLAPELSTVYVAAALPAYVNRARSMSVFLPGRLDGLYRREHAAPIVQAARVGRGHVALTAHPAGVDHGAIVRRVR